MLDVIIVGAGIAGCASAFECSKYKGSVLVLEKNNDVADETTKANSAILHAGYDPQPGTLMAKYNVAGNKLVRKLCADLDVPCNNVGSFVVAFDEDQKNTLQEIMERGKANGVPGLEIIEGDRLHEMEPFLSDEVVAALYAPTAAIIDPWGLAIALMETAVKNGVDLHLSEAVTDIKRVDGHFVVTTDKGEYEARTVLNAAGVDCDTIDQMVLEPDYEISPNKGEYFLLDKSEHDRVLRIIFQCPTAIGKGVLVAPTVHGNVIVGPTSVVCEKGDTGVTADGLGQVRSKALRSIPSLDLGANIRNFAGIRARKAIPGDFIFGPTEVPGYYRMSALCSPGLSSANAMAVDFREMLAENGLFTEEKKNAVTTRRVVRPSKLTLDQRNELIGARPEYGRIICRCETISEGEIIDSLNRPFICPTIDGVKRRCNAGMGRCQGGFCQPKVLDIIARETGMSPDEILQDKEGSWILCENTRDDHD